jgi:GMP synthase (glutamine-hydrolysing)
MQGKQEMIVVLDFGSQYNQLITRRIREFGVYSELHPHTITAEEIQAMNAKGIVFSGGPNSVYDENAFACDPNIFELGLPIYDAPLRWQSRKSDTSRVWKSDD